MHIHAYTCIYLHIHASIPCPGNNTKTIFADNLLKFGWRGTVQAPGVVGLDKTFHRYLFREAAMKQINSGVLACKLILRRSTLCTGSPQCWLQYHVGLVFHLQFRLFQFCVAFVECQAFLRNRTWEFPKVRGPDIDPNIGELAGHVL